MSNLPRLFPSRLEEPPSIGWFRRTFRGAVNPVGALAALNNLHLSASVIGKVQLESALRRYGVVSGDARRSVMLKFCSDVLARVLAWETDKIPDGRRAVERLASDLGLSPGDTEEIRRAATGSHVRSLIMAALSDRKFTPEERDQVRAVGKSLGMDDDGIDEVVRLEIQPLLTGAFEEAIADRRYSPAEEASLQQFAADLGTNLQFDEEATAAVQRYRLMWDIENGRLPEIAAPITLQRKEVCHYRCDASWRELRTRTVRVDYHGPTARIRIMKGVYWRVGSIAAQRVTETNLVEVARGTLYVTNKRVILHGQAGNKSVTWRSVFGQEVFSDAIKLEKSSGKDPYLFVSNSEIEMASTIIAGAMAAAG